MKLRWIFLRPLFNKKRLICAMILLIFFYLICNLFFIMNLLDEPPKTHLVIISATLYEKSTIYTPNTIAMLINTRDPEHDNVRPLIRHPLVCVTRNGTHTRAHPLTIRPAYASVILCKWSAFYALCESVAQPFEMLIQQAGTTIDVVGSKGAENGHRKLVIRQQQQFAKVPFRHAFKNRSGRRMDVINCFSPLYFYERWQTSITAFEIFRHFGVNLQILYVESVQTDIYKLLKMYEDDGIIRIEPWTDVKIKFDMNSQIDYDINAELEWRNQPSAHLDCFFKYREASKWIIIGDVDDILLPKIGSTYIEEFKFLSFHYEHASAFRYARYNTRLSTSVNSLNYSLVDMLSDVQVSLERETGKAVLNTRRVMTTWMHWLGDTVENTQMVDLEVPINVIFHFRNYTYREQRRKNELFYKEKKIRWSPQKFHHWLDRKAATAIDARFRRFLNADRRRQELFRVLPNGTHYFDIIDQCYDRILYSRVGRGPPACPGPQRCDLPKEVAGLRCMVADRAYERWPLNEESSVYVSSGGYTFYEKENGCIL